MTSPTPVPHIKQPLQQVEPERLALDESAIDAARRNLSLGAVTPHFGTVAQGHHPVAQRLAGDRAG